LDLSLAANEGIQARGLFPSKTFCCVFFNLLCMWVGVKHYTLF